MFEGLRTWWDTRTMQPVECRRWARAHDRLMRNLRLTDAERHAAEFRLIPARFFANEAQRQALIQKALTEDCYCYIHRWDEWSIWMDDQRFELLPGGELHRI